MANDKTEKATPKKKEDARKKGQVAKSADINGAAILLAGLIALSAAGPKAVEQMKLAMVQVLQLMAHPDVVDRKGVGTLFMMVGQHIGLAILPIVGDLLRRRPRGLRRPGRPEADAERDQAGLQEAQPGVRPEEPVQPAALRVRERQERHQDRDRRRDRRRWRCSPSSTRWRPWWARRRSS